MSNKKLHLFEGYGIELEYMIVDKGSLNVMPISDKVLFSKSDKKQNEIINGDFRWSNELVLHVIEIKTNGPIKEIAGLDKKFKAEIDEINKLLANNNSVLMPTSMHPWMNPKTEMKLWPHDDNMIYDAFNKIFDCSGHGWSNLQSVHINLPFFDDDEFGRLHGAIRIVLPLIPALASSSPVYDNKFNNIMDNRMIFYKNNSKKIPSITGKVIPEAIFTIKDYKKIILDKMYDDIALYDKDKVLQDEWLNARGAIARFDRNTIEIRITDISECPKADMAVIYFIISLIRALADERFISYDAQKNFKTDSLARILDNIIINAENSVIDDLDYLAIFNVNNTIKANELLDIIANKLIEDKYLDDKKLIKILKYIIDNGTLSTRIIKRLNDDYSKKNLFNVYNELKDCLANNALFS